MRRVSSALFVVLAFTACPPAPGPTPTPPSVRGDGWVLTTEGTTLRFTRDGATLLSIPAEAFVVGTVSAVEPIQSYDPYWLVVNDGVFTPTKPPGFSWRTPTEATLLQDADGLTLSLTYNRLLTATVRASKASDGHLLLRFTPKGDATVAMLRVKLGIDAQEAIYGLGEWFDGINHRGKVRPLQLEPDLNVESAATENHVSVPLVVSPRGWGAFFETRRHGVMDVAKTDGAVLDAMFGTLEESSAGLPIHLFSDVNPVAITRQYHRVTGFPRLPADWATGPWIWRNENKDQAEVEDDVKQLRDLDLATSGVWIDRPYASEVNTFDFKPSQFPDAGAMIATIHRAGLRLALWHTPYLAPGAEPLYSQATDAGFFPPVQGAWFNRWGAPLDTTRPEAVAFWKQNIARYTAMGVEGFKLDFAEDVAAGVSGRRSGWTFFDGQTDRTMTDGYPRAYHQMYRDVLGDNDGFLLVRHARWGEQTTGLIVWPGDIDATLTRFGEAVNGDIGVGGLPAAVRAGIGLSVAGFPLFASDTGGYRHAPPNKETFIRWVEHAALMPVMQTGDSTSQPPWLFTPENGRDAEALELYRQFARLHLRLFPYFWSHLSATEPLPVVRAFGLAFPALNQHPEDQYLLGDALLVAPVETAGATSRTVIKPPGRWFDFDTGAEWQGEAGAAVTVAAPLLKLPLFLREGALVPMLEPSMDTLAPSTDPAVRSYANDAGTLWVRVQPGGERSRFELFDGTTLEQEGSRLVATKGTRFTGAVVWELRGVSIAAVTHGGAALPSVSSLTALEAAAQGVFSESGRVLIKTPLDGAPTSW